jgi:hypothetical protein
MHIVTRQAPRTSCLPWPPAATWYNTRALASAARTPQGAAPHLGTSVSVGESQRWGQGQGGGQRGTRDGDFEGDCGRAASEMDDGGVEEDGGRPARVLNLENFWVYL